MRDWTVLPADTGGSAFYLAVWESDDSGGVRDRLGRNSRLAEERIDVLENEGVEIGSCGVDRRREAGNA